MSELKTQAKTTLGFGKHKGREIDELATSEGRYLIWLYTCDWVNQATKDAIENEFDKITLEFGRHKGKTMSYIKESDQKYFEWITKPFVDNKPDKQVSC
jgi:uncharacterized protein (DUF3820 family)